MSDLCRLIWSAVFALFRSRAALHAEILFLRHQLNVLHRRSPKRVALSNIDRLVFAGLYCLAPQVLDALKILKPETVIRWHRAGFRAYWHWRSRPHGGRPGTAHETQRRCRSPNTTTLSKQSRLIEPISRSAYPFCHGDRAVVGRSRMPIA